MNIEFDPIADAAYFEISGAPIVVTKEIEAGVMGDYDADRHLVGIEVLAISKRSATLPLKQAA